MAIKRGTDTECYCVCSEGLGRANREKLILNITLFYVGVWGGQYREELVLNVTVIYVRVWGGQYRK